MDEDIAVAGSGPLKVEVDLMQPLDPAKSPKVHEPALNHVGLWIDDLAAAVAWLEGRGVRFTPGGVRKGASGFDVCFIHPKGNEATPIGGEGVLIELVQAPPEVIAAFGKVAGAGVRRPLADAGGVEASALAAAASRSRAGRRSEPPLAADPRRRAPARCTRRSPTATRRRKSRRSRASRARAISASCRCCSSWCAPARWGSRAAPATTSA